MPTKTQIPGQPRVSTTHVSTGVKYGAIAIALVCSMLSYPILSSQPGSNSASTLGAMTFNLFFAWCVTLAVAFGRGRAARWKVFLFVMPIMWFLMVASTVSSSAS